MDMNSLLNNELIVFSTNRALREFKSAQMSKNCALLSALDIGEFFSKAVIVKGLKKADNITKLMFLKQACQSVKEAHETLKIPLEFFAFLKSSEYLFSLFNELDSQNVSLDKLKNCDNEAFFDNHIDILKLVKNEYNKNLKESCYYDTICADFCINENFINQYKSIKIYIDGILSKHELNIISQINKIIPIKIICKITRFNTKLKNLLKEHFDIDLKENYSYEIDLQTRILDCKEIIKKEPKVKIQSFSLRSLQASFIFDEISNMMRNGLSSDEIVVILPDENFAGILQNLDEKSMLNYAMGKSVSSTQTFAFLNAINRAIKNGIASESSVIFAFNRGKEFFDILSADIGFSTFCQTCIEIAKIDKNVELENIILNELFTLEKINKFYPLKISELLELLLQKLNEAKLSLSGGGAVTAMGLLESRGSAPKGVIIIDFNDDIVPKRSKKEMFLSSKIRAHAGLISHKEREDLQKSYYENLINNCEFLSISYVNDEQSVISRFIKILGLKSDEKQNDENEYSRILSKTLKNDKKDFSNLEFKKPNLLIKHDFFAEALSYSRLDTFLKCKELYYYKYILKIPEIKNFNEKRDFALFGNVVHKALYEYFSKNKNYCDYDELCFYLDKNADLKTSLDKLEFQMLKEDLRRFVDVQNAHFAQGWEVLTCEEEYEEEIFGVKMCGKIDRIDVKDGQKMVIDYKTGSLPKDDLQLQIYKELSKAEFANFFDLKNMEFNAKNTKNAGRILEEILNDVKEKVSPGILDFSCDCKGKEHSKNSYKMLLDEII